MATPENAEFLQFLLGMAGQTMGHLGQTPNPITKETGVDLKNAKYSIDLLLTIREKTRGNLDAHEERFFANIVSDLQMRYLDIAAKHGS